VADRPLLVRNFAKAFRFTTGQSYKIFGWFPDASGALKDSAIDALPDKQIRQTQIAWDAEKGCPLDD
jgi:hypothetical protein